MSLSGSMEHLVELSPTMSRTSRRRLIPYRRCNVQTLCRCSERARGGVYKRPAGRGRVVVSGGGCRGINSCWSAGIICYPSWWCRWLLRSIFARSLPVEGPGSSDVGEVGVELLPRGVVGVGASRTNRGTLCVASICGSEPHRHVQCLRTWTH